MIRWFSSVGFCEMFMRACWWGKLQFGWGWYCKQGLVLANCQWLHCQKAGWDSQGKCYIKRDNQRESNHQEYLLKKVRFRQLAAGLLDWLLASFLRGLSHGGSRGSSAPKKELPPLPSTLPACLSSQHYAYDQENKLVNMLIAPNSNKTLSFCPL